MKFLNRLKENEGLLGARARRTGLIGGVLLAALTFGEQAGAAVTVQFTGTITGPEDPADPTPGSPLNGPFNNLFTLGEAVSGSYSFDPATPDTISNDGVGDYVIDSFSVDFAGGFSAADTLDTQIGLRVVSNFPPILDDYKISVTGGFETTPVPGDFKPILQEADLILTSLVFDLPSDALPLALDLADYDYFAGIVFRFDHFLTPGSFFEPVVVELDTLTFVPEPATLALLGLGTAALIGRRRRGV